MQRDISTDPSCRSTITRERCQSGDDAGAGARAHLSEILIAVAEKSEPAMAELYRLTSAKLYGICLYICNDRCVAEDILHDVYERIWQHAGSWKYGVASPISWLAAIARNRSIDWCRKHTNKELPLAEGWDAADDRDGPDAKVSRSWDIQWCKSRLATLDDHCRNTLNDVYLEGMTFLEISLRDDISVSTVKSRAQRGIRKLQIGLATINTA